jgi:hypothetical protein
MDRQFDEQSQATRTAIGPKQWFCLFHGDSGPMGVAVESVAEVLETDSPVRLAWSPPQLVGMCSYHREVIPVVVLSALSLGVDEDFLGNRDQVVATSSARENSGCAVRTRCVVLILKTEHGAWGLALDSENATVSRECPTYHAPRTYANGPVLIGVVERAGTYYRILDAAATWHGIRSAIGAWFVHISESNSSSSLASGEEPNPDRPGTSGGDRSAEVL